MEKPCNGRKNSVTGYSRGWSLMIIMRLSVRILQLRLIPSQQKEGGKMQFLITFPGWSITPRGNQACMSRGRVSKQEQQQAAVAVLSPCLTPAVMNVVCHFWGLHSWQACLQLWLLLKAQRRSQSATSQFQVTVAQQAPLQQYTHFTPSCSFCQAVIFN